MIFYFTFLNLTLVVFVTVPYCGSDVHVWTCFGVHCGVICGLEQRFGTFFLNNLERDKHKISKCLLQRWRYIADPQM